MSLKSDYDGVAYASRVYHRFREIFQMHLDDIGAMVHETTHIVQQYRTRNNPGWLVEGIADYVRFFKYEPGKIGPTSRPKWPHYDGSYRVTAAFLQYLTTQYDKEIVLTEAGDARGRIQGQYFQGTDQENAERTRRLMASHPERPEKTDSTNC